MDISQFNQYLDGVTFPIKKQELVQKLRETGTPQQFLQVIENLQETEFTDKEQVISKVTQAQTTA